MILKKVLNNKIICSDLKYCQSFTDRSLGLLRKSNPKNLLFKTRFGIHTFFLKEPIDVIILNEDKRIVGIKKSLKPNRLFFWNPLYSTIIELEHKTINKFSLKPGNLVVIK